MSSASIAIMDPPALSRAIFDRSENQRNKDTDTSKTGAERMGIGIPLP
jgi:hypothetical protein